MSDSLLYFILMLEAAGFSVSPPTGVGAPSADSAASPLSSATLACVVGVDISD